MKVGKVPENVLKRSVFKQIHTMRPEVVLGAGVGEDCAAVQLAEDETLVMSTDPITGTAKDIGTLAIQITVNDLASAGAEPVGVLLTVLLPTSVCEQDLCLMMKQVEEACAKANVQNMGVLSQIAGMLPGNLGKSFDPDQIDEKQMAHNKAIILSMTPLERENPQILNASRKKRIAAGCGLEVVDVNRLLKSFEMLQQMTSAMAKGKMRGGLGGLMGGMGGKVAKGAMHGFGRKKRLK